MDLVIECSSVYAIDFAAVVFSIVEHSETNKNHHYHLFINEKADIVSNCREYISRLALPTLSWERDQNGVLRQVHIPIEHLDKDSFIVSITNIISILNPNKSWENHFVQSLQARFELLELYEPIDIYICFIEMLIEEVTGEEIKVLKYGEMRDNIPRRERTQFFKKLLSHTTSLPDGKYRFSKGGHIVFYLDNVIYEIRHMEKDGAEIVFSDEKHRRFKFKELVASDRLVLRGPLETLFLCTKGILLDLPWYVDAQTCELNTKYEIIEYISPISVSSKSRTASEVDGCGYRLHPSGYSLLDYRCDSVLRVINKLYHNNRNTIIEWRDMNDWVQMVHNYPSSRQKVSKSQAATKEYCELLLSKKMRNRDYDFQFDHGKFVLIGYNLTNLACAIKMVREYSHPKSIYYRDDKRIHNLLDNFEKGSMQWLYEHLIRSVSDANSFAKYFQSKQDINDRIMELLLSQTQLLCSCIDEVDSIQLYKLTSKLEKYMRKLMVQYYEIVSFISGTLLKANLFTAFSIMQEEYPRIIKSILDMREKKHLRFLPKVFTEV